MVEDTSIQSTKWDGLVREGEIPQTCKFDHDHPGHFGVPCFGLLKYFAIFLACLSCSPVLAADVYTYCYTETSHKSVTQHPTYLPVTQTWLASWEILWNILYMGVSIHGGFPIAGWFIREHPIQMDYDWGYPYFRKPPHGHFDVKFISFSSRPSVILNEKYTQSIPRMARNTSYRL